MATTMVLDAFDPGPLGAYPNFPRNPDGSPCWSDTAAADATVTPMPRGLHVWHGRLMDMTPRDTDGTPIVVPTLAP